MLVVNNFCGVETGVIMWSYFFYGPILVLCPCVSFSGPPLWSSDQSSWLQTQRYRVGFPGLPDFLSSSGSGTGSTQPREVKLGATSKEM
jgi:hypothetical protein